MARSRAPRIIGRIFKLLALLLVVGVSCLVGWRVCASENYDLAKGLKPNEALKSAYATHGNDLILQYQTQPSITRADKNYGYFSVVECVFIPQAKQVQLVVRYNNSTLEHLKADYGLAEVPDRTKDWYDVTLAITTDLTPENTADNILPETLQKQRIHATGEPIRENTKLYTYRRYTFDNVEIAADTIGVFVDINYLGDTNELGQIDYEKEAYGTLLIYEKGVKWEPYRLSREEKKLLK